jgi:Nucleotidyl transferase AbiEii toxin, Type IV TA system
MTQPRTKAPGNLQGLERWITEWARDGESTPGRLRRRIGVIALAAMIEAVEGNEPTFVFKGGAAFELRFGHRARSTSDVDAIFRGNLDDSVAFLERALAQGWSGFTGTLVDKGEFQVPGVRVSPRRSIAKIAYCGRPFLSLPIEVAAPEGNALDAIERVIVAPLAELGLGAPGAVALMGAPYQIAQKLHACTTLDTDTHVNDRAHDLADLLLLNELATIDPVATKQACLVVFEHRQMHSWPPVVHIRAHWPQLWKRIVDDDGFPVTDINDAAHQVQQLIERIDGAFV